MPLYEYKCQDCARTTEFLEQADTEGNHACSACGSERMKKAFSGFATRSKATSSARSSSRWSSCASCTSGSCASCRL